MNTEMVNTKWNQVRGEVQHRWGRLTNADLDQVQGQFDKLVDLVRDRYGYSASKAQREVNKFFDRYGMDTGSMQEAAGNLFGGIQRSMNRYPWAFIAGALVIGLVIVGFVFRPFDNF